MRFTDLVLIAWIPACTALFALVRPARAGTLAFIIGWLALPCAKVPIQGFLDIDKVVATSAGVLLGMALFATREFTGFRLSLGDVLLVLSAGSVFATSIDNDLGVHDGVAQAVEKLLYYGMPYLVGRAFLKTRRDLVEAGTLVVGAASVYGLLALWEWRMSPTIHLVVYGFFQHGWRTGLRWGFYRPILCFAAPLALGTFFAWTALLGVWMYRARLLKPILGVPPIVVLGGIGLGLVTSMSFGPWAIFVVGLALLKAWQLGRGRGVAVIPLAFAVLWMFLRYTAMSDGEWLSSAVAQISGPRAASLQYRIDAETELLDKAKIQPVFGWGGFGRSRVYDETGKDLVATDGLWVIYTGMYGLAGLITFFAWWCYPVWADSLFFGGAWRDPVLMVVLIVIGLHAVSFMFNAFLDPVVTMMGGGAVTHLARTRGEAPVRVPTSTVRPVTV